MLSSATAFLTFLSLVNAQAATGPQSVTGICGVGNICQNGACCAVALGATSGCKRSVFFVPFIMRLTLQLQFVASPAWLLSKEIGSAYSLF